MVVLIGDYHEWFWVISFGSVMVSFYYEIGVLFSRLFMNYDDVQFHEHRDAVPPVVVDPHSWLLHSAPILLPWFYL